MPRDFPFSIHLLFLKSNISQRQFVKGGACSCAPNSGQSERRHHLKRWRRHHCPLHKRKNSLPRYYTVGSRRRTPRLTVQLTDLNTPFIQGPWSLPIISGGAIIGSYWCESHEIRPTLGYYSSRRPPHMPSGRIEHRRSGLLRRCGFPRKVTEASGAT